MRYLAERFDTALALLSSSTIRKTAPRLRRNLSVICSLLINVRWCFSESRQRHSRMSEALWNPTAPYTSVTTVACFARAPRRSRGPRRRKLYRHHEEHNHSSHNAATMSLYIQPCPSPAAGCALRRQTIRPCAYGEISSEDLGTVVRPALCVSGTRMRYTIAESRT